MADTSREPKRYGTFGLLHADFERDPSVIYGTTPQDTKLLDEALAAGPSALRRHYDRLMKYFFG